MFLNISVKQSRIINFISQATFGVLLIHANSDLMRQWLWKDFLNTKEYFNSNAYLIHAIISIVCVYVICTIIELIRKKLLEEPIFNSIEKHWRLKG